MPIVGRSTRFMKLAETFHGATDSTVLPEHRSRTSNDEKESRAVVEKIVTTGLEDCHGPSSQAAGPASPGSHRGSVPGAHRLCVVCSCGRLDHPDTDRNAIPSRFGPEAGAREPGGPPWVARNAIAEHPRSRSHFMVSIVYRIREGGDVAPEV